MTKANPNQLTKAGKGAPEGVEVDMWRRSCRTALQSRIKRAIREDKRALRGMR